MTVGEVHLAVDHGVAGAGHRRLQLGEGAHEGVRHREFGLGPPEELALLHPAEIQEGRVAAHVPALGVLPVDQLGDGGDHPGEQVLLLRQGGGE